MNVPHEDGSLTLDNASVQRLMDYNLLHFTDEGWVVSRWDALAAAARQGGDVQQAPGEAPQSGPARQGNAQRKSA